MSAYNALVMGLEIVIFGILSAGIYMVGYWYGRKDTEEDLQMTLDDLRDENDRLAYHVKELQAFNDVFLSLSSHDEEDEY